MIKLIILETNLWDSLNDVDQKEPEKEKSEPIVSH